MAAFRKTNRFGRKRYVRRRLFGARKPYRPSRMLRSFAPRPEVKKWDIALTSTAMGTTGTVRVISQIAQGINLNERIGNRINNKYITIQGYVQHNNTATIGQYVKMWLIRDNQQVADTPPTTADFLQAPANAVTSPMSSSQMGRVTVIASRTFIVDPSNECKKFKIYKKLYGTTFYNGVLGNDYQKNVYYFVFASSDGINSPTINYTGRLGYTDV